MYAQDDTQQRTELRLAFLRHLPRRVEQLARRARRFCEDGWDINGLLLLYQDAQRLAGTAGRYGALDTSEQLHGLETWLGGFVERQRLPDADDAAAVAEVLDALAPAPTSPPLKVAPVAPAGEAGAPHPLRFEVAPPQYWRRWLSETDWHVHVGPGSASSRNYSADRKGPSAPRRHKHD